MVNQHVADELEQLEGFGEQLSRLLEHQDEAAIRFRPRPDMWSIAEILGHLIVFNARWANRIRQMLAAQNPRFINITPEDGLRNTGLYNQEPSRLLQSFAERRQDSVDFLRTLTADHLSRTGTLPGHGSITINDAINTLVANDEERMEQIRENLAVYRSTVPVTRAADKGLATSPHGSTLAVKG